MEDLKNFGYTRYLCFGLSNGCKTDKIYRLWYVYVLSGQGQFFHCWVLDVC